MNTSIRIPKIEMNTSFLLVIAYGLFIWLVFLITARVEKEEEKASSFVLDDWDIDPYFDEENAR